MLGGAISPWRFPLQSLALPLVQWLPWRALCCITKALRTDVQSGSVSGCMHSGQVKCLCMYVCMYVCERVIVCNWVGEREDMSCWRGISFRIPSRERSKRSAPRQQLCAVKCLPPGVSWAHPTWFQSLLVCGGMPRRTHQPNLGDFGNLECHCGRSFARIAATLFAATERGAPPTRFDPWVSPVATRLAWLLRCSR